MILAYFALAALFLLLLVEQVRYERASRAWERERQVLLDRIMAASYTEFQVGRRVESGETLRYYLTDEEEAALARSRGDG